MSAEQLQLSKCLPIGTDPYKIPVGSILTTEGWLPPEHQPSTIRYGFSVAEQIFTTIRQAAELLKAARP